jgi:hypothetical protein
MWSLRRCVNLLVLSPFYVVLRIYAVASYRSIGARNGSTTKRERTVYIVLRVVQLDNWSMKTYGTIVPQAAGKYKCSLPVESGYSSTGTSYTVAIYSVLVAGTCTRNSTTCSTGVSYILYICVIFPQGRSYRHSSHTHRFTQGTTLNVLMSQFSVYV